MKRSVVDVVRSVGAVDGVDEEDSVRTLAAVDTFGSVMRMADANVVGSVVRPSDVNVVDSAWTLADFIVVNSVVKPVNTNEEDSVTSLCSFNCLFSRLFSLIESGTLITSDAFPVVASLVVPVFVLGLLVDEETLVSTFPNLLVNSRVRTAQVNDLPLPSNSPPLKAILTDGPSDVKSDRRFVERYLRKKQQFTNHLELTGDAESLSLKSVTQNIK